MKLVSSLVSREMSRMREDDCNDNFRARRMFFSLFEILQVSKNSHVFFSRTNLFCMLEMRKREMLRKINITYLSSLLLLARC